MPMMGRGIGRRGPGLVGMAARTAVVAGTATAVSGRVAAKQQQKAYDAQAAAAYEQQQAYEAGQAAALAAAPPPPPAAPAASPQDTVALLKELAELKDAGVLTEAEFAAQKAKILG